MSKTFAELLEQFVGPEPKGMHKHKCTKGHIWEHRNGCFTFGPSELFEASHTCPECGEYQDHKYAGPEASNTKHFHQCTMSESIPAETMAKLHQWTGI